jgi:hypothetical protein
MKRLLLVVLLGVAAAVVAPVASASAAEAVECTLKGKATFTTARSCANARRQIQLHHRRISNEQM